MVNNVEDEKRTAALVSLIGRKTYGLLKSLTAPEAPSSFTFKQLTDLLRNHFNPKPLVIAERFRFYKSNQLEETVSQYAADLRRLAYGTGLFVAWQVSTSRKKLLAEDKPTFYKAVAIAVAMETATKDAAELQDRKLSGAASQPVYNVQQKPVGKPSGTVQRLSCSKLDSYPIPRTEDLLATLGGGKGKLYTKLDLSQAYQQVLLDDESKPYLTINTHRGLFTYNRLPFGVKSAPGIFQRVIESKLNGVPCVIVRMDDILISGLDDVDHLKNLQEVLTRLSAAGLRLNRSKCTFMAAEVLYCGRRVSSEGTRPNEENIEAIVRAPSPSSVTELRSYLGMLNFYNMDLPHLATTLEPLHRLLRKNSYWNWTPEAQVAFEKTKQLLTSSSFLTHYDESRELILACDSSPYGVGAVISHVMDDGSEKPIAFASRTLNSAERNYSQLDKEGLAIIFGVRKFHQMVYGRPFVITTGHKPLLGLFGEHKSVPAMASPRLIRWILTLSAYNYVLKFKEGRLNGNADCLSRLPLTRTVSEPILPGEVALSINILNQTPVDAAIIKKQTDKDPVLCQVLMYWF